MYIDYILIPINGFKTPKILGYKNIEHLKQRLKEYGAVFMKTEEAIELPEQIDNVIKIENTKEFAINISPCDVNITSPISTKLNIT